MLRLNSPLDLNGKLAAYAALAGAALAGPAAVNATVVDSGPLSINIQTTNINGLYINFVTGANNTVGNGAGTTVAGWDMNPYSSTGTATGSFNFFESNANNAIVGAGGVASSLAPGTFVGPASAFITGVVTGTPFRTTGMEYAGLRFTNESTGAVNYGWALFSTNGATGFPATLLRYSYDDAGGAIQVPIPEPGTFALLGVVAAGALGLRQWRKRNVA